MMQAAACCMLEIRPSTWAWRRKRAANSNANYKDNDKDNYNKDKDNDQDDDEYADEADEIACQPEVDDQGQLVTSSKRTRPRRRHFIALKRELDAQTKTNKIKLKIKSKRERRQISKRKKSNELDFDDQNDEREEQIVHQASIDDQEATAKLVYLTNHHNHHHKKASNQLQQMHEQAGTGQSRSWRGRSSGQLSTSAGQIKEDQNIKSRMNEDKQRLSSNQKLSEHSTKRLLQLASWFNFHFVSLICILISATLIASSSGASTEAERLIKRSIAVGSANQVDSLQVARGKTFANYKPGAESDKKKAAAELIARQLLSNFYRAHLLESSHQQHESQLQSDKHFPGELDNGWHIEAHPSDSSSFVTTTGQNNNGDYQHASPTSSDSRRQTYSGNHNPVQQQSATEYRQQMQHVAHMQPVGAGDLVNYNNLLQQQQQQQASQPTTPTLNKQLVPPPPPPPSVPHFYQFGLAQTSALQLEPDSSQTPPVVEPMSVAQSSLEPTKVAEPPNRAPEQQAHNPTRQLQSASNIGPNNQFQVSTPQSAAPVKQRESTRSGRQYHEPTEQLSSEQIDGTSPQQATSSSTGSSKSAQSKQEDETPVSAPVEKGVEPRQRRRMFNRILKKAEWNHLFVELSKVFLRYFLDLALKDIIGKQSGGASLSSDSGSSSSSSTSGRKKLDAQSELTDLLKDFVKTAISNM